MKFLSFLAVTVAIAAGLFTTTARAQLAGEAAADALVVADGGKSTATIVVSSKAGEWEKRAAADLALYIEKMTGAKVLVANTDDAVGKALAEKAAPVLIVG